MKNNFTFFRLNKPFPFVKGFLLLFISLWSSYTFGQSSYIDNTPGGATSFTVPFGVTSITVDIWGGGGAGGGSTNNDSGGSGGGSGGYSSRVFTVTPNQTINYTTGVGGTGGTGTGGDGTKSTITIGATTLTANGGSGGGRNEGAFGIGGTATGGTTNTAGNNGATGTTTGNKGGDAPAGGAGGAGISNNDGNPGEAPGGGGGGGEEGGWFFNAIGGNGGDGGIKITFTCSTIPITATEGFNLSTNLPSCWNKQTVTGADYLSVVGTDVDPFTTPVTTTPFEGAYMVKYNSFTAPAGNSQRLVTPPLSSLGITGGVDVEFYWSSNNTYKVGSPNPTDRIQIQYSTDAITWVSAGSTVPRFLPYDNQNWIKQTVNIPTAVNNVSKFYIGFLFISDNSLSMYMDKVTIKPTPKVILVTPSSPILCTGSSTILTASSTAGYSYTWSPSAGLSSTTGSTVTANPASTTTYTVTGVNGQMTTTQTVTVSVNTVPTSVSATPITNTTCDATTDYVTMTSSGGVFANSTLLTEDFNGAMTGWSFANTSTGGTPSNSSWTQRNNEYIWRTTTFASNDNTSFLMSNSDSQNGGTTITAIVSPSVSTVGLTSINLSFYQYFRQVHATDITKVQFSINGGAWNDITQLTQTTTQGSAKNFLQTSFVLNSGNYPSVLDKKDVKLRFFYSSPNGWYWAIDNVVVTGTGKRVTWSPATGLYTNTSLSNPYTLGDNGLTVYAAPDGAQVYTPTSDVGLCSNTLNTVDIKFNNKKFSDANGNWDIAANWFPAGIPDATRCVRVPDFKISTVNILGALAKSVTVDSGGKLTISPNQALTITDGIINNAGAANFVVQSDANLIQINPSNSINVGSITAERSVTDMDNLLDGPGAQMDYVYWSSPVTGQNLQLFSPGTPANRIFEYKESTDFFVQTYDGVFLPGKGYAIRAEVSAMFPAQTAGYNKTYAFVGKPNNGDLSVPIKRSVNSNGNVHGYNLIGNPYPSNINFDELYAANATKIYKTAWLWNNTFYQKYQNGPAYNGNNYAIYNGTGGNSAPVIVGGTTAPNGIIKVGQGFIVQSRGAENSTSTLEFKNNYGGTKDLRVSTAGTFYQKNSESKNRFWLTLESPDHVLNSLLIGYIPGATDGFEIDCDAEAFDNYSDLLYSVIPGKKLLIQGKSAYFTNEDKVTLGANFFQNASYTIAIDNAEGIFEGSQNIYLKDKQEGIITNLSQGSYTFTAAKGDNATRFEIIYKPETILATGGSAKDQIIVYRDGTDFVIKSPKALANVEVYDNSGKLMVILKPKDTTAILDASAIPNGGYVLKIKTKDGDIVSRKIVR